MILTFLILSSEPSLRVFTNPKISFFFSPRLYDCIREKTAGFYGYLNHLAQIGLSWTNISADITTFVFLAIVFKVIFFNSFFQVFMLT